MNDLRPLFDNPELTGFPMIIAGPCSAETREQLLETATDLSKRGIKILRAGVWKPRTKPGGFEGAGLPALEWLSEAKTLTGMLTATEVANKSHVEAAIEAGIDLLWIGARTSANPFAMQEVADALAKSGHDIPVLVKNPVNPDLELWIGALERLYNAGIHRLGAIHRGFSAYGKHLYRNMPQWYIPIELRRRLPALPVINDPSHIGGKRELIASISQQALDMGFDGLIIESHCDPDQAWSDKSQQVTPEVLEFILNTLVLRHGQCSTEGIKLLRQQIDTLDNELLEVLNKRMEVSRQIGLYKKEHNMPVVQTGRYDDILRSRVELATEMGMSSEFMRKVLVAIHEESVRIQVEILNRR